MEETNLKTIKACQAGNMESFILIYDQYIEKIYRFLFFRTLHKQVAEDLTSQVFIKAMDRINTFNVDKGTFQSWLYQIARNVLIDESRKRKPIESIEMHSDIPGKINLENETNDAITHQALRDLLNTLPKTSQELITMRLWDELSYADIATITGKTQGSLKMQFSRIIEKLQQHKHLLTIAICINLLSFII